MIVEFTVIAQCKLLYLGVLRAILTADANAKQRSECEFESCRTARTALLSHPALVGTAPALFGQSLYSVLQAFEGRVNQISSQHTIYAVNGRTNFAPADVCDNFAPGRGQNDAYREVPVVRWRGAACGLGHGAQKSARDDIGLDGAGTTARHLGEFDGASI